MYLPSLAKFPFGLVVAFSGDFLFAATIDDFSVGQFQIEVLRYETESTTLESLPTEHVLGGSRLVTLNAIGPTSASSVRVGVDTAASEFRYDADPGASAANFRVVYGDSASLQADLLGDGANAIVFDFGFADFESGVGYFDIAVATQPGGRYLYVPVANSAVPFSLVLPYRAFENELTGADFGNVSRITFGTGNGNLRGSFALTDIRTAYFPEGDYNFDHSVNEQDFLTWRSQFGKDGPYSGAYPVNSADGNRDGVVDSADYVIWRKSRDAMASKVIVSNIPETTSHCLALLAIACVAINPRIRVGCRLSALA